MFERIQQLFKIRRRNVKTFLFFLLFATVVWVLVQFSKVYTKTVNIPLNYINHPLDKIILDENPDHLKVKMTDNGFGIMYYRIFTPTLDVDLSETSQDQDKLIYKIEDNRADIQDQLGLNFNKSVILKDQLEIHFFQKRIKKVPVISNITVNFEVGYGSPDVIVLQPDSIQVSGHKQVIDTLQHVRTLPLELKKVNSSIQGSIEIDKTNLEKISLYTEEVNYFLKVEKFTEGRVSIPIEVMNVPNEVEISIFPKEVILVYQINLENYNKINASDFRVVCDFEDIDDNQNFLIPEVVSKPEMVKNLRLNERKIEFVIKR